jgi:hypothetical protein
MTDSTNSTTVVGVEEVMLHLNVDHPVQVYRYVAAAEDYVGNFVGKPLSEFEPLPDGLRQAVKMLAGHLYENREASIVGVDINLVSPSIYDLMAPHREYVF